MPSSGISTGCEILIDSCWNRTHAQLTCQYRLWYSSAMTFSAKILTHIQQADTKAATLTPKQLWNTLQKRMCFTHESQYSPYYAAS
jgi:hypothetical protein